VSVLEKTGDAAIRELLDREAIRDCLHRYTRAVDRRDFQLLETVFWPDATDNHGAFNGPIADFYPWVAERVRTWPRTQHNIQQIIISIVGDEAAVETYFVAYQLKPNGNGGFFDEYVAGRYLDRMTRRENDWRVQKRITCFDWFRHMPDTSEWAASPFGQGRAMGAYKPQDPMYALFGHLIEQPPVVGDVND
jgi:hypothetical protein